jgi:hypothetical protein
MIHLIFILAITACRTSAPGASLNQQELNSDVCDAQTGCIEGVQTTCYASRGRFYNPLDLIHTAASECEARAKVQTHLCQNLISNKPTDNIKCIPTSFPDCMSQVSCEGLALATECQFEHVSLKLVPKIFVAKNRCDAEQRIIKLACSEGIDPQLNSDQSVIKTLQCY